MEADKLKDTCRICLKEQSTLKSLFGSKTFLARRINQTFRFDFEFEDTKDLPTKICLECITDLHHGLQFFERAKNSQERLAIMLNLSYDDDNIEEEIVDAPDENPLNLYEQAPTELLPEPSTIKEEMVGTIKQELGEETGELDEEYLIEEVGDGEMEQEIDHYEIDMDLKTLEVINNQSNNIEQIVVENPSDDNGARVIFFKCCECEKMYDKKTSLQYHLKTKHSDDRQFKCTFCNKAFAIKSDFVRHSRIHTNDKRYICSVCGKKFTDRSTHLKHERIHSGSKPYQCTICSKSFGYSFVLKNHLLTHTGEKDFDCPMCSKAFARKSKMKDHLRRVHSLQYNADGELISAQPKLKVVKDDSQETAAS